MSDNAFWCTLWCCLIGAVCCIAVCGVVSSTYLDCQYIKNGYTRATLVGSDFVQWVKETPK